ncbi:BQ5605_C008g05396 [Microbotryum silenes-dioicae]|uniref:BQ5605_C008g05396 protein n=1 Tax=Microbotryum silenes-dioicae TaxID=796604 RepID=A0A2X0MCV2_9BASI|nr:BQ5605_C008g05396 [Microbotryum silenes-dioicae]
MGFPFRGSRAPGARASFFARGSQESVPCGIWQLPIYTVDFSSARAIDRAPRFDGFWRVPPFRVGKVDFSSARAIDRAPRFDGFAEKVEFSSARAVDRALSIFIFTGNLGFYSKTYPGIGLYPTYDTYILNLLRDINNPISNCLDIRRRRVRKKRPKFLPRLLLLRVRGMYVLPQPRAYVSQPFPKRTKNGRTTPFSASLISSKKRGCPCLYTFNTMIT